MSYDPDNIFGKILRGEIPSEFVYEDEDVVAFNDINPQAPVHILIIPRKGVARVADFEEEDAALIGKVILAAKKIAAQKGMDDFRLVFNNGPGADQSVFHVHLHLLAGRSFGWPPG